MSLTIRLAGPIIAFWCGFALIGAFGLAVGLVIGIPAGVFIGVGSGTLSQEVGRR